MSSPSRNRRHTNDGHTPATSDDHAADFDGDDYAEPRRSSANAITPHALATSWRRTSIVNIARPAMLPTWSPKPGVTEEERCQALQEQANLLRDNDLIAPEPAGRRRSSIAGIYDAIRRESHVADETTPLLDPAAVNDAWERAITEGKITTTWQLEAKVILRYSVPLAITFLLQYSLTVASILTVGRIGVEELGAVSIAAMTANITGYMIYQGLATSLDTLCAQAYGSGRKLLVGLHMQRMVWFLWLITIPIGIVWWFSNKILAAILPAGEAAISELAGLYLKIVIAGAPGYAAFEAGKRYVQAQGLFSASMYVLFICAPFNAFLNWLLVWRLDLGFKGAPIAVAITNNLLPLGLWIYVRFLSKDGMSCWGGLSRNGFNNWGPMISLAVPGLIMVEAEFLAFEALTFAATYFGAAALGAQSVVASVLQLTFQIPFALSIAGATRVANLIGATLDDTARRSGRVTLAIAIIVGAFNLILLGTLRSYLPRLFTSDSDVVELTASILPICALCQLFDSLAAYCNGMLRALGRQEIGGYIQLFSYYVVALPISFGTGFGLSWQLKGFWTGVGLALVLVTVVEYIYLFRILSWEESVEKAQARNRAEEEL